MRVWVYNLEDRSVGKHEIAAPGDEKEWSLYCKGWVDGGTRLLEPVTVSDLTDGRLTHLAGLNLSRAWTWRGIASALPEDYPGLDRIEQAVLDHANAGLESVCSGYYEGEHWLASFAVYLLTEVGM